MQLITRTMKVLLLLTATALCAASAFASVAISSSSPLSSGTVAVPYSVTLTATGGTSPYTWSIGSCSGSCNTGLALPNFATSGIFSGTPANAGTSTFGLKVTDAAGNTATKSLAITISAAGSSNSTLSISTASLPAGKTSVSYTATLGASGGKAPYTWAIASCSGSCNTGLAWSTSGVLSGTPASAGTSTFGFKVTDAAGNTASKSLPLTVSTGATTTAPVAVSITPESSALNTGSTQQFTASLTGTTNTSVNWSVNGTQGGSATVGTISTAGLYKAPSSVPSGGSVTVTATSAADTTKSASAKITIDASTAAVTVSVSPTSASVTAGKTKQFTASVSGTTSTGVTWQVNSVTSGNSTVGTVSTSGLYTAPSSVPSGGSVTVTAVSSYETTASAKATVAVTAAATPPPSGSTWSGWNFTPTLYASPTGSGSTCSSSSPCTIDYAFNTKATAGSVIQAAAGTYASGSSHLTLSKSGTSGKPIVLTCVTRGACHITGTSTGNTDVMGIAGNYITFDGFDVSNVSSSIPNSNMIIYLTGSHDILSRNAIHDVQPDCGSNGGGAVQTGGSTSYNTYDANLVYNVGNNNPACKSGSVVQVDGILDETNGVGDVVENNIIYNIYGGWGITHGYPDGAAAAITIVNNLVFEVGDGGIALTYGAASSIIKNNMMIDNGFNYSGGCGLYGYSTASGMQISNNDADGNSGGAYCQSDATGTIATSGGDLSAAPASTFVNWQTNGSGNYQESASSPTIGAGTSASAPDHDFAGNTRSGSTDIGPYQHTN